MVQVCFMTNCPHFLGGIPFEYLSSNNFNVYKKRKETIMLVRRNISAPMFSSVLNDFLKTNYSSENAKFTNDAKASHPAVNIKENEHEYVVEMAVPGFKKEDFVIDVKDDVLTISSNVSKNVNEEKVRYTRREYEYAAFKRIFTLPENMVDVDKIAAKYENGELIVQVPKREETKPKPPRSINIA